jgi:hypothetical protein
MNWLPGSFATITPEQKLLLSLAFYGVFPI